MDDLAPRRFAVVEECVEQTLARLGRRIVLCTPIGAGKPVALVNEFYRRAERDPRIELAILTGLTLARDAQFPPTFHPPSPKVSARIALSRVTASRL